MSTYTAVLTARDLECISLPDATPVIVSYRALQAAQDRAAMTRARLGALFPGVLAQFDTAARACELAKSRADDVPIAALEMRNLVDKLQGELFERARRAPKENMTWSTMIRVLAPEAHSLQHHALTNQAGQRQLLYSTLSNLLKRRGATDLTQLLEAWTFVVDHVFVVCGCVSDDVEPLGDG
jgi:hypothetical protein